MSLVANLLLSSTVKVF